MPDRQEIRGWAIFFGFLIGVVVSVGCLLASIGLGSVMNTRLNWVYPAINGAFLLIAALLTLRSYQ
jgi:hypothetical protein